MANKILLILCVILAFGVYVPDAALCRAADAPPSEGGVLPNISLLSPDQPSEQKYLGLDGKGSFKIPEIRADVVVIEVFSMYCPFCQKEAPNVNELYGTIENNNDWKNRIKIIGIGAGNSPFEVDVFKKTYSIAFPLFPDNDFSCHEALGKTRTPYFIVIKMNKDGSHKVVYSKVGTIGEPKGFLDLILKESAF